MSLTGRPLAWLAIVATLAGLVALVWFWPVLSDRHPTRIAARAVALLGVNLLVLLTAAIQLNDRFLFFASWRDLAGAVSGTTNTSQLRSGSTAADAAKASTTRAADDVPGTPQPLPAGSQVAPGVRSYSVTGPLSGISGQILLALPPGYDAASDRRYPVIETFSGYPGSLSQWVKTMSLPTYLSEAVRQHTISETVVISPQVEVPAGADTECVNGRPGTPQLETWLARDVPNWLAAHVRIRTDRGSWTTMGLSSGGWCAAMIAMLNPDQYGGAVVFGGYFRPIFTSPEPYPSGGELALRYDLVALAESTPPPIALWMETSPADPVSYDTSAALLKAARPPLSVSATVLQDTGHRTSVWRSFVPLTLTWIGANLPGFRP
jgi:S-formylglutathione hydrolase FrmB